LTGDQPSRPESLTKKKPCNEKTIFDQSVRCGGFRRFSAEYIQLDREPRQ
jgi:hypothetical protein